MMQELGKQVIFATLARGHKSNACMCADACLHLDHPHESANERGLPQGPPATASAQQQLRTARGCSSSQVQHAKVACKASTAVANHVSPDHAATAASKDASSTHHPPSWVLGASSKPFAAASSEVETLLTEHHTEQQAADDQETQKARTLSERRASDHVGVFQQSCELLGHLLDHCSSHIFNELRQKMKVQREFFDPSDVPKELLDGSVVGLKTMLAKGMTGQRGWSDKGMLAVVKLLLAYDRDVLLAQLGMLSQVCSHRPACGRASSLGLTWSHEVNISIASFVLSMLSADELPGLVVLHAVLLCAPRARLALAGIVLAQAHQLP